jgi:lactate racemase
MQIIKLPQLAWFNPRELELVLPEDWNIEMPYMEGYDRPESKAEEILESLRHPIGCRPLGELARGKKEAVIVFDDTTRVTRTAKIVPLIIRELAQAGIADKNIRFICASGAHGAMRRTDFVKKLGEDIVSRFRVFNHNAFGNCSYVGKTKTFQTDIYINEEYLKCDLKIAIGSCVPHPAAGFGGGSKLILPGLSSFESISQNHKSGGVSMEPVDTTKKTARGMGYSEENRLRKDMDDAVELAGLDFLITTVNNLWGEPAAIYAGSWKQSFAESVKDARHNYLTSKMADKDIVISNSYAKSGESLISLTAAIPMINKNGGDIVVIDNAPEGQVTHYLVGLFGNETYACQYKECRIPPQVNKVIIFTEYPHPGSSWFEENPKIVYMNQWSEVIKSLKGNHGPESRVGVIPDATVQYFAWYD